MLALIVVAALVRAGPDGDKRYEIEGKNIIEHIKVLAHDRNQGRAAGSPGATSASDYIVARLKQLGLKPVGDKGTYFQNFTLPRGFDISPETSLQATRGKKKVLLKFDKDLKPLSLSGPGRVEAGAVFVGYGIAAPGLGYDDYAELDVKGKVVICLRRGPAFDKKKSPFSMPGNRKRHAVFQAKVNTAVGAGAAALVIINDPKHSKKAKKDVPLHKVGGNPSSIPVFHLSYRAGKKLARVCGFSLQREQNRIDKSLEPASRVLDGVTLIVNADLKAKLLPVRNICALLEAPRGATETLVIGAHFDHVGLGAYGSLAGSKGKGAIHNGADDNASGTCSVLEIAAWFVARRSDLRRDVLFLWFTAEELGLLGSKHYVGAPIIPLERCVAMVNLDMVGRLKGGRLQVGGTGTSPIFPKLLTPRLRAHLGFRQLANREGRPRELRLRQGEEEVGLVLRRVGAAPQQPASMRGLLNACVVSGRHLLGTQAARAVKERRKLQVAVAVRTGQWRAPRRVLANEVRDDRVLELAFEIQNVVWNTECVRDTLGVVQIVERAATAKGLLPSLIVELHRQADHVKTLLGEQGRGDRGIDAAGHGHDNAH